MELEYENILRIMESYIVFQGVDRALTLVGLIYVVISLPINLGFWVKLVVSHDNKALFL